MQMEKEKTDTGQRREPFRLKVENSNVPSASELAGTPELKSMSQAVRDIQIIFPMISKIHAEAAEERKALGGSTPD